MKFLFFGMGSIGQRHARNLKELMPKAQILSYLHTSRSQNSFEKEYNIKTYTDLDQAFAQNPTTAFITNPTSLHVSAALECARRGIDMFIEKPLSDSWDDVEKLESIIKRKKLVTFIGFMMRYNTGLLKVKKLLDQKVIGNVVSARIANGEYLPDWHPGEDYRNGYSARGDLGGGVILTFTHELDYASWFFGEIDSIYCCTNKSSLLHINVEEVADIVISYKNCINASIHLDYIARPPVRCMSVIGETGRLEWDYYAHNLKWYTAKTKKWHEYTYHFDRNDMFKSELREFLKALKSRKVKRNTFSQAKENLKLALSAKKSTKSKKKIRL